jgi:hypothetical protein
MNSTRLGLGLAVLGLGIALFVGLPPNWWPNMPILIVRCGLFLSIVCTVIGIAMMLTSFLNARRVTMTIAELGYNAAIAGSIVTFVTAILSRSRLSIIACVVAITGVGIDYWFGPARTFIWSKPAESFSGGDLLRMGLQGEPLGWSRLYINNTIIAPSSKPMNISTLTIMGGNVSDKEITLDEAYFLSGIDGTRLDVKISWGGAPYKIREIKPIPAGAFLFIISDPIGPPNEGLSQEDFYKKWAIVTFIAKYNGVTQRIPFDQAAVKSMIPKPIEPFPHISPKKEH